jgi:hypothetical protein
VVQDRLGDRGRKVFDVAAGAADLLEVVVPTLTPR